MRPRAAHLPATPGVPLEAWGLAGLVVLGLAVRLWFLGTNAGMTADSPIYLRMADSLAAGRPAIEPAHHGYPTLIAGLATVLPGEWPGRIVSMLCGVLLILVVHGLGRAMAGPRWALVGAGVAALHPSLIAYSGAIAPDSMFVMMVAVSLLMISSAKFSSGGLWLGLGYVVRADALWIAPAAALFSREVRGAVAVLIAFLAVAIPYAGYLRLERGHWDLAPPAATSAQVATADAPGAAPAAATPGYLPRLGGHAMRLLEQWPLPLLLLSLFGIVVAPGPLIAPLVLLPFLPLLGAPPDGRFLLAMLPSLAAYAAVVPHWVVDRWPRSRAFAPASVAVVALAGLALCWVGAAGRDARGFVGGPRELRQAGEWLRANGRPGAAVMDRQTYVPYFAQMRHVPVPDGTLDAILEEARASGVDYLVVEDNVAGFDERLAPLFADGTFRANEPRVRVVHEVRLAPLKGVMVFEVVRGDSAAPADSVAAPDSSAAP